MPADNEIPEFVQAEVRISRAWVKTDQDRAVVWLADALDKAQKERDAMSDVVRETESAVADGWASKSMRDAVVRYRASLPSTETKP